MKTASKVNPVVFVSAALAIAVYFFILSDGGLRTGFSHDDLMNMWRAWQDPLPHILKENLFFFLYPSDYRPLGTLFYHVFYNAFGLDPMPYRVGMLVFLLANIYLVYAFARRISQSREIGAVTALLHAYHTGFTPLYRNTGTCYDILCCFFYLSALVWYLRIRQQDRLLRPVEQIGILSLLICALDAKEIAVTLPVLIGVYELLYHPPSGYKPRILISWLLRDASVACWGMLIDLAFIFGKIYRTNGIGHTTAEYTVRINLVAFMQGMRHDLDEVFITWGTDVFRPRNLAILLLLLFLFAWRSRLAYFRFALLFWLVGVLPVEFLPSRSIYAIYIPLAGFDLCAATLFIETRDWLWRGAQRLAPLPDLLGLRQILTFVVLLLLLSRIYYLKGAKLDNWEYQQSRQIGSILDSLRNQLPTAKKGAHMLFLKDPFEKVPGTEWATAFVTQLFYRDNGIHPDRLWKMREPPDAAQMRQYDYIFTVVVAPDGANSQEKLVLLAPR
jgi:hypothetical protein